MKRCTISFCYDVQVRYALGYRDLSEGHFELRTVYNFRRRVTRYMQETGENLIEAAFEQVTDEQIVAFELKTNKLRMDSTLIAGNIRDMSRIQLLVEVLQRMHRMLAEQDQQRYADEFCALSERQFRAVHLPPQGRRKSSTSATNRGTYATTAGNVAGHLRR